MALTIIERNVQLDLYDHDLTPSKIKAIALDSKTRYVGAEIHNGGQTYDVGQNTGVTLTIIRPDKTGVQITGETFTYAVGEGETVYGAYAELTQTALAISGTLKAQFMLTSGDQILRTETFDINNGVALDAEVSEWAGEYQGYNLDELVQSVNESSAKVDAMEADVSELKSGLNAAETDIENVYIGKPTEVSGVNKLNPSDIKQNTNIDPQGNESVYNGIDATGYIDVRSNKTSIAFTGLNTAGTSRICLPISRILFYDANKSVLSYVNDIPSRTVTPIPSNAVYARFDITSGYMRDYQPMVELVDAKEDISTTYIQYEEVVSHTKGLNELIAEVEALSTLPESVSDLSNAVGEMDTEVNQIASDVNDLLGATQTIDTLATFANGGINSGTGAYDSYYKWRVATPQITNIDKDITLNAESGFRIFVARFVNGVFQSAGWVANGTVIDSGSEIRIMIARASGSENTGETADVDLFCSKVTYTPDGGMSALEKQVAENTERLANIDSSVINYGLTWDWWITSNSIDTFGNAYIGYVDTDGYAGVLRHQTDGTTQYKRLEKSYSDDDHNGMATIVLDDGRILVIGSHGHGQDNRIICWRSTAPYSIDSMEQLSFSLPQGSTYSYKTTYSQIFKYNGKLFDFLRCTVAATGAESVTGYLCLISEDNGTTWTPYQMLTFGDPYITFAQCTDDEKMVKMVLGVNPNSGSYTFKGGLIDLSTYKIYDLNNAEIGHMIALGTGTYDSATIAKPSDMTDLTTQTVDGKKGRLFTVAKTAKADTIFLYATAIDTSNNDYTYKIYNDGEIVEIGTSGTPFGNVSYISGVCFGKDVNTVYYSKATTIQADGAHELHKVKITNGSVESDDIVTETSICMIRPLFLGNGEIATVVGHYNDRFDDGTYNGSFTAWELKPLFTHA